MTRTRAPAGRSDGKPTAAAVRIAEVIRAAVEKVEPGAPFGTVREFAMRHHVAQETVLEGLELLASEKEPIVQRPPMERRSWTRAGAPPTIPSIAGKRRPSGYTPLRVGVANALRERAKALAPGASFGTLQELAHEFYVSKETVSQAFAIVESDPDPLVERPIVSRLLAPSRRFTAASDRSRPRGGGHSVQGARPRTRRALGFVPTARS